MHTHTSSAILFAVVALGVALQLATVSQLGARIVMGRIGRHWNTHTPKPAAVGSNPAPTARQTAARRRCRDYRTALRTAQMSAK